MCRCFENGNAPDLPLEPDPLVPLLYVGTKVLNVQVNRRIYPSKPRQIVLVKRADVDKLVACGLYETISEKADDPT